jgi:hypothetical protein
MELSRFRVVTMALLLLLAAGESLAEVTFAPKADDNRAKNAVPPSGKALVFLFREEGAEQKSAPPVWLDDSRMGTSVPRSYYLWALAPGRHTIAAGNERRVTVTLDVESGRNYFVELRVAANGTPLALKTVAYARGRTAVNRCRLIEAESAFTAMAIGRPAPKTKPTQESKPVSGIATGSSAPGHAQGVALRVKTGSVKMTNRRQTIQTTSGPVSSEFAGSTSSPFSFEGEWRRKDGLAVGLELVRYSNKLTDTSTGLTSTMDFSSELFNGKKYFSAGGNFYPYLGLGAGVARSEFSGAALSGDTSGLAYQVMFGFEMRWRQISAFTELKRLSAKTEDDAGNSVEAGTRGLYIGASMLF